MAQILAVEIGCSCGEKLKIKGAVAEVECNECGTRYSVELKKVE